MDVSAQLYRLPKVLEILSISKSKWWQGIKDGHYPQPVKLGPRTTAWRARDIHDLAENGIREVVEQ